MYIFYKYYMVLVLSFIWGGLMNHQSRKKKNGLKKISLLNLLLILIILVGAGIFAYPTISDLWNSFHQSRAIAGYVNKVEGMKKKDIDLMLERARLYNRKLAGNVNRFRMSDEEREEYDSFLDINGTGIMAYVEIPKIHIRLPVYHGTQEKVLQTAVGHVEGSSLPVGGKGTHAVLSGHRGLPSAKLFSDIDQLEKGDRFILQVLNKKMLYQVDQIRIVLPDQLKSLTIDAAKDYVTLVTCTPYGINTHRLLVRGERAPGKAKPKVEKDERNYLSGVFLILLFVLIVLFITAVILINRLKKMKLISKTTFTALFIMIIMTGLLAGTIDVRADEINLSDPVSLRIHLIPASLPNEIGEDIKNAHVVFDIYKMADVVCPAGQDTITYTSENDYGFQSFFRSTDVITDQRQVNGATWRKYGQMAAAEIFDNHAVINPLLTVEKEDTEINDLSTGVYLIIARGEKDLQRQDSDYRDYIKVDDQGSIISLARSEKYEYSFEPEMVVLPSRTPYLSDQDSRPSEDLATLNAEGSSHDLAVLKNNTSQEDSGWTYSLDIYLKTSVQSLNSSPGQDSAEEPLPSATSEPEESESAKTKNSKSVKKKKSNKEDSSNDDKNSRSLIRNLVKTGDDSRILLYIVGTIISLCIILWIIIDYFVVFRKKNTK